MDTYLHLSPFNVKKKLFLSILIMCGMTFKFEYLGKLNFILKYIVGSESGDQERAFDEKKTEVENLMQVYLSDCCLNLPRLRWI
jgi:hypothetical protein